MLRQTKISSINVNYVHFPAMHHLITNFFVAPSATFIIGSIIVFFVLSFLIVFHNNRLFSYPNACFCNYIFIMILVPGCMLAYNLHHDSSSSHVLLCFSALLWRFPHKELRRKLRVPRQSKHDIPCHHPGWYIFNWFSFAKPSRQVREGMYVRLFVQWTGLVWLVIPTAGANNQSLSV